MKTPFDEQREAACLVLTQGLLGLVPGLLCVAVMAAVAVPNVNNMLMTHRMAQDFEGMAYLAAVFSMPAWLWLTLLGAALLPSWTLTARAINPNLPRFPFSEAPVPTLAWTAVLLSGAAFWLGLLLPSGGDFLGDRASSLAPLASGAIGGAACWLILSPWGWAGDLRSWRPEPGSRAWPEAAAAGASFGLLAGFGMLAAERSFAFLFRWVQEVGFPSPEVNPRQALVVFSLPVALSSLAFAGGFGLAPAWSPAPAAAADRLRRALLPAGLLVAAAAWLLGLHREAVRECHWRAGSLAEAAGLPDRKVPEWTLVVLGADGKPEPTSRPWPQGTKSYLFPVPATAANARALEAFLAGPGRRSRFRREAADALVEAGRSLWDEETRFETADAVAAAVGDRLLEPLIELAWLNRAAPITPANRARLAGLSDPARYRIRGKPAWLLAKAWHRFGDREAVRRWHAVARLSYVPSKDEGFELPAEAPFAGGSVQGRLNLGGKPAAGVRVGLFAVAGKSDNLSPPYPGTSPPNLAASQTLGHDGAFRFEHLTEGRYGLCLLVPPGQVPPQGKLKASKLPGVLSLSKGSPRADVGLVALTQAP